MDNEDVKNLVAAAIIYLRQRSKFADLHDSDLSYIVQRLRWIRSEMILLKIPFTIQNCLIKLDQVWEPHKIVIAKPTDFIIVE